MMLSRARALFSQSMVLLMATAGLGGRLAVDDAESSPAVAPSIGGPRPRRIYGAPSVRLYHRGGFPQAKTPVTAGDYIDLALAQEKRERKCAARLARVGQ